MASSERTVHTDLRAALLENVPFKYAHLIKFERPSRPDTNGKISTSAERYTYITDASRDVVFDDLSKNLDGVPNGLQTYRANKVLSVGAVQEAIEAKADSTSITLDGNGIGASLYGEVSISSAGTDLWDVQVTGDPIYAGFREGDKINIGSYGAYNIENFRENNVVRVKKIDNNLTLGTYTLEISLDSEEIKSILLNKNANSYSSFINREVYVYRAYFIEGQMIGETPDSNGTVGPILLFKGIINNVSFEEDDTTGIKVQWGLSSHWGDFSQVRGRVTSDEFHRALDQNGIPQPEAAIKPEYAYDKGFMHSDTSINLLATYTVMVDKTTVKAKNGFFGLGAKTKVKTVAVPEGRTSNLDFQLQAKSIPVIYGVRNTVGTPIFADTLKANSSEVYVVYALSEGQIGGIYDVYVEGKSLICNNQEDFDARSTQTTDETVDVICRGRADRGDILGGVTSVTNNLQNYYYDPVEGIDLREVFRLGFNLNSLTDYYTYSNPTADGMPAYSVTGGILHGQTIALTSPQTIALDFFSGTSGQSAASQLVGIASSNSFKVQNDYWTGTDSAEYWGPNHRLIDTAYIVGKFTIKEGETTIPDIEFIVRGKVLDCYNYDFSYTHDEKMSAESPNNFLLGDIVQLSTGQTVQIIDKWEFCLPNGQIDTRFRFSEAPDLDYVEGVPSIKRFTMTKSGNTWTMITFNWDIHSGNVGAELSEPATVTPTGPGVVVTFPTNPDIGGGGTQDRPVITSLYDSQDYRRDVLITGTVTSTQVSADAA